MSACSIRTGHNRLVHPRLGPCRLTRARLRYLVGCSGLGALFLCSSTGRGAADTKFSFLPWSCMDRRPFFAPSRTTPRISVPGKGTPIVLYFSRSWLGSTAVTRNARQTIAVRRCDLRRGNCLYPGRQGTEAHPRNAHRHGLPIVLSSLFAVDEGICPSANSGGSAEIWGQYRKIHAAS